MGCKSWGKASSPASRLPGIIWLGKAGVWARWTLALSSSVLMFVSAIVGDGVPARLSSWGRLSKDVACLLVCEMIGCLLLKVGSCVWSGPTSLGLGGMVHDWSSVAEECVAVRSWNEPGSLLLSGGSIDVLSADKGTSLGLCACCRSYPRSRWANKFLRQPESCLSSQVNIPRGSPSFPGASSASQTYHLKWALQAPFCISGRSGLGCFKVIDQRLWGQRFPSNPWRVFQFQGPSSILLRQAEGSLVLVSLTNSNWKF